MSKIKQQQLSFSSPCAIEASNSSLRNRLRSASFPGSLKKTIRVAWMDMLAEIASFFQICLVLGCIPDTFRIQQQRVSLTNTSILFFRKCESGVLTLYTLIPFGLKPSGTSRFGSDHLGSTFQSFCSVCVTNAALFLGAIRTQMVEASRFSHVWVRRGFSYVNAGWFCVELCIWSCVGNKSGGT